MKTWDALAPTARSLPQPLQGRPQSTARDLLRNFWGHSRHHCDNTKTAVTAFTSSTTLYKSIRWWCGNLSCSDATASLSVMPSRLSKIQIQIKFKSLCNGHYCDDAAAPNAAMPPPLYRWGRCCLRLVRGCPASYPTFFQPSCKNLPLTTAGMPWPPLRHLCGPCCDILLLSLLWHHGRLAARMPSPLSRGCPRPLVPLNPAHYWDLAPLLPWGCLCIQCRDALTFLGRMPLPTP
jgi:hypothetical protein